MEFYQFAKVLPKEVLTHEFVSRYLFNRVPQQFENHQLRLFSFTVIAIGDLMFEVTVNCTIVKRIFFR